MIGMVGGSEMGTNKSELGQYPTPDLIVSRMLNLVDLDSVLKKDGSILDPGCGEGAFILECLRRAISIAKHEKLDLEWIISRLKGIELDSAVAEKCRESARKELQKAGFKPTEEHLEQLIVIGDFLRFNDKGWDVIVANPPYVRLESLSLEDRDFIKASFKSAVNRFDLYFMFFERSLQLLRTGGRLCFITPQKYAQVWSGSGLRQVLSEDRMMMLVLLDDIPTFIVESKEVAYNN